MSPFGFTPASDENPDENSAENSAKKSAENSSENSENLENESSNKSGKKSDGEPNTPADFAALVEAFQDQVRDHFTKLGMSSPFGFSNLFNSTNFPESGFPESGFPESGFPNANFANSGSSTSRILPEPVIRDVAKKFVAAAGSVPISLKDKSELESATALAEHWLDSATQFPARTTQHHLVSRIDWVDATLAGWSGIVEPLAQGLATAITEMVGEVGGDGGINLGEFTLGQGQGIGSGIGNGNGSGNGNDALGHIPASAFSAILTSFLGTLLATQLGQSVGALAHTATGVHDIGLPLVSPVVATLIPQNIAQWGEGLELPEAEVQIFHALREGAIARLFDSNPWLVDYIRAAITSYGHGIRIDLAKMQEQAESAINNSDFDINNPESFTLAMKEGFFTPEESPEQKQALEKLETVLALIDGWCEEVISLAADERLPSLPLLLETLRRRRATSAPVQQLFHSIFGLHVSPRMAREASTFWRTIRSQRDIATRDQIWSAILPSESDIARPMEFLASSEVPDDLSGITSE
jgi:putative hydrolase